jgi:hypothetical protein
MANLGAGLIGGTAQTLLGIGQMIFSHKGRDERDLQNYANTIKPNQSIMDYYNKALAKYNPNAYASSEYQNSIKQNQQNQATSLAAANSRHAGVGVIGGIAAGTANQDASAAGQAEAAQRQNFGQLGQATNMSTSDTNRIQELQFNLRAQKAAAAGAGQAAGAQNISGGLQSGSNLLMAQKIYGGGTGNQGWV